MIKYIAIVDILDAFAHALHDFDFEAGGIEERVEEL